jgi:hypothetical protein
MTQERVLRRLLTAVGSYFWWPYYGAGLPTMVGQVARAGRIRAIIRRQMSRESGVAQTPTPTVQVSSRPDGTVYAFVLYGDADTGQTQTIFLPSDDAT